MHQGSAEISQAPRPVLICLPSADHVFCDRAGNLVAALAHATPAALEDALKALYPHVRVRRRELDGEMLETWYVYRDRSFPARHDEAADAH